MTYAPVLLDESQKRLDGLPFDTTGYPGRFVVTHCLTTYAGVSLNRDFDNMPKQINYGDDDRMRVSSQAIARAMRTWARDYLNEHQRAANTRCLPKNVADVLTSKYDYSVDDAADAACAIVLGTGMGISWDRWHITTASILVPDSAADRIAQLAHTHWDELAPARAACRAAIDAAAKAATEGPKRRGPKSPAKKTASAEPALLDLPGESAPDTEAAKTATGPKGDMIPKNIRDAAKAAFDVGGCLEIALFGRMLANIPGARVDGALSIAHGFAVDVIKELADDFTAVDDWQSDAVFGASMQGTQYLASGTLYRYAVLDRTQLRRNLANVPETEREDLAQLGERLFTASACLATPSSKRTRTGSDVIPTLAIAAVTNTPACASPVFEHAIDGPAGAEASRRLAKYLCRLDKTRVSPISGGYALWMPPTEDMPAPILPATITIDED